MSPPRARVSSHQVGLFACALLIIGVCAMPANAVSRATPDPVIASMLAEVQSSALIDTVNRLTGVTPATVGGAPYTFTTRDTTSGEPIRKATQFVYESMQMYGLPVSYQAWHECGIDNRNVVAEKVGAQRPGEIVLLTAHIDSVSSTSAAPGADDNASGTAAVMAMAQIMNAHQFQRTVRFVLFTGEEQGLCGSAAYAGKAAAADEEIVAVYNLDMIAWDSDADPIVQLHTRKVNDPGYTADLAIANTFVSVVNLYGLRERLVPHIIADGLDADDTYSFWDNGYAGILAIEDDDENGISFVTVL
jgi:hypothetical protein